MTDALPILRTVKELRNQVVRWHRAGQRVAVVPTMGALHDGHLSLIALAKTKADHVVATIFVNPAQFGPNEDFDAYPRGEARDAALLAQAGCDVLYAPQASEMYPAGFSTTIAVTGVSEPLDGQARPGHFAGVATVVAKLLIQTQCDSAVFGEKDYQQLQVIRRMARDLDLPVEIIGAPTSRAADGLALSSRNAYLNDQERITAGQLNHVLARAAKALAAGEPVFAVEQQGVAELMVLGFGPIDYLEARAADDLARLGPGPVDRPARLLVAAKLGKTRLIDNLAVD